MLTEAHLRNACGQNVSRLVRGYSTTNGSDAAPSNILCVCASPRVSCAMIECYLYWLSDSNTASPTDS